MTHPVKTALVFALLGTAILTGLLGVGVLALASRRRDLLLRAVLLAALMTPVCHVLFRFAGFGI